MNAPRQRARRPRAATPSLRSLGFFGVAAIGVIEFYNPPASLFASRPGDLLAVSTAAPTAMASRNAFGRSGEVLMRFALPASLVEVPLEIHGEPSSLSYQWLRVRTAQEVDSVTFEPPLPLAGAQLRAPSFPGFYRLALVRGGDRQVVDGVTLAVMVPFSWKLGSTLNGYRIGTYLSERRKGREEASPLGFVEVQPEQLDLPVSSHFRLADFITRDKQTTWPRYAAVDPKVLDKVELVLSKLSTWQLHSARSGNGITVDVHSGFRTPIHNRGVRRAAQDSRHQYGDAVDIAIDANGDGRVTAVDARVVGMAVDSVEAEHPDLVGGLGTYGRRAGSYVHIDTRGKRARWRG
jgi:uncharacterized protein YcbK (DUF882 family)